LETGADLLDMWIFGSNLVSGSHDDRNFSVGQKIFSQNHENRAKVSRVVALSGSIGVAVILLKSGGPYLDSKPLYIPNKER
jgi:hypothetical protein